MEKILFSLVSRSWTRNVKQFLWKIRCNVPISWNLQYKLCKPLKSRDILCIFHLFRFKAGLNADIFNEDAILHGVQRNTLDCKASVRKSTGITFVQLVSTMTRTIPQWRWSKSYKRAVRFAGHFAVNFTCTHLSSSVKQERPIELVWRFTTFTCHEIKNNFARNTFHDPTKRTDNHFHRVIRSIY